MKKYNFIQFDGIIPRGDTKIAINKSGLIRLSSGFCRTTNIKSFNRVALFYDSTNHALAIKFIKPVNKQIGATFATTVDP